MPGPCAGERENGVYVLADCVDGSRFLADHVDLRPCAQGNRRGTLHRPGYRGDVVGTHRGACPIQENESDDDIR